ncbi:hypothetical protein [Bacillus cereus]|uniref:hypothetical protein n=1 Tax=Bacillus cereus TaxID=1396 RepID=UPI00061DD97C|nr:hypothetical protein [Bacillus cereus]AKE15671.1 hypothetical protein FORC5_1134 [Bacillus cereus]
MKYEMTIKEACNAGFWSCLTPTDWIQLGAIIISLFSVLIALYASIVGRQSAKASEKSANFAREQLELNNQQRKDAVRPDLFIKATEFQLIYNQEMNLGRFNSEYNGMILPMNNVGSGHAKKVKFEWDFDEFSSKVDLIMENEVESQYIIDYKEGSYIFFNESSHIFLDLDLEYSMPMSSVDENYGVRLPSSYIQIFRIIIHLCITKKLPLDLIPKIKLSLTYADILGNQCSQKFVFTPNIIPQSSTLTDNVITDYTVGIFMKVDEIL